MMKIILKILNNKVWIIIIQYLMNIWNIKILKNLILILKMKLIKLNKKIILNKILKNIENI